MRVLHVTTEFPPIIFGGLGTAVGGLVNACARGGIDVGVLLVGGVLPGGQNACQRYGQAFSPDYPAENSIQPIIGPEGVPFFQISPYGSVRAASDAATNWGADIMHLHTAWVWPFAKAILDNTRIPMIYTVHSVDRAEYEIGQEPEHILGHSEEQGMAIAKADRIIALTRNEGELIEHCYPCAGERIRIIGNGIDDYPIAHLSSTKMRRHDSDSPLVLYCGRLVERKGIREFLAAIPRVLQAVPSARFVLAGGPPHYTGAQLEREWLPPCCYPYRSQIHFTGWLSPSQVAEWYCAADIQVVPSRYEPFGMVVLEGMLYGLAMIAASIGGPAEILQHGQTGLLFPPRDIDALAEALLQLLTDHELRRRIGCAAAHEVRRKWLWPHIVGRIRNVYCEVISRKFGRQTGFADQTLHQTYQEYECSSSLTDAAPGECVASEELKRMAWA